MPPVSNTAYPALRTRLPGSRATNGRITVRNSGRFSRSNFFPEWRWRTVNCPSAIYRSFSANLAFSAFNQGFAESLLDAKIVRVRWVWRSLLHEYAQNGHPAGSSFTSSHFRERDFAHRRDTHQGLGFRNY